ncbi:MAG: hypothetical protein HOO06_05615 [Bdellovibrionaceae bacterium]|jgi:hypothetical protein|nr:hypothetical protein [Pseudobdellovibrionaceae bacterium]
MLNKIRITLFTFFALSLTLAFAPNTIAQEQIIFETLLADSNVKETEYSDDEDDDYAEDDADDDDMYADVEEDDEEDPVDEEEEEQVAENEEKASAPVVAKKEVLPPQPKVAPPVVKAKAPLVVKQAKPVVKRNVAQAKKKKYKGKFRRLSRDCNMRSIASVDGSKVGIAKKKKKLWTQQIDERWIEVQRKAGPAYIRKTCF